MLLGRVALPYWAGFVWRSERSTLLLPNSLSFDSGCFGFISLCLGLPISLYLLPPPWWLSNKDSSRNAGHLYFIPGLGRSPGVGNATHSSVLAWKISWTEEPGGLQSMESQSGTRLSTHGIHSTPTSPSFFLSLTFYFPLFLIFSHIICHFDFLLTHKYN